MLVYKEKTTGKRYLARRLHSFEYILTDIETKGEMRVNQRWLKENFTYMKKESKPNRWGKEKFRIL